MGKGEQEKKSLGEADWGRLGRERGQESQRG